MVEKKLIVRVLANVSNFRKGMRAVDKRLDRSLKRFGALRNSSKKLGGTLERTTEILDKINAVKNKISGVAFQSLFMRFQGWALSIMFFGMAIQRSFQRILRAGVTTFTRVMESSEMFGSAIQQLAVHWEFLKFVIGSAINRFLEPLLPVIIRIITAVSEWVQKNKKLTAALVIGMLVFGTLLMLFGMLALAFWGIMQLVGFLIQMWPVMAAGMKALAGVITGALGFSLWWIIGILALLWLAWKTNFAGIRDFAKDTFKVIWNVIKGVFGGIWKFLSGFWELLGAIWNADLKGIISSLVKMLDGLIDIIINVVAGIAALGANIFALLANIVIDLVNLMIRWLNVLIRAYNAVASKFGFKEFAELNENNRMEFRGSQTFDNIKEGMLDLFGRSNEIESEDEEVVAPEPAPAMVVENINVNTNAVNAEELLEDIKRKSPLGNFTG